MGSLSSTTARRYDVCLKIQGGGSGVEHRKLVFWIHDI
jgi:hypothetical protein